MITKHEIRDTYKSNLWTVYKSTFRNNVPMGFEYEIQSSDRDRPKLPEDFAVHWEGLHYEVGNAAYGWEIKSPIAPLHYHKYLIRTHFKDVPWCYEKPGTVKNMGGIHVNVSSDIHNGRHRRDKIVDFARISVDEIFQLSGRDRKTFDKYCNPNLEAYNYYNFLSTRKSYAFELRMYAALPNLLLPALETADSLFELANERGAITLDKWMKFISRWPRYRNINQHVRNTLCKGSTWRSTVMAASLVPSPLGSSLNSRSTGDLGGVGTSSTIF